MHRTYLLAALEQAFLGLGFCAPNPSVGTVVVSNGEVVARGYHKKAGGPHAEIEALNQLKPVQRDLSLYVTLEPCNHWGKTPPCTEAIIRAHRLHNLKEVVFAYPDPNPIVSKNSTERILSEAGIRVEYYPLPEIDAFYRPYQRTIRYNMPYVRAKLAMDIAGNTAGEHGRPVKITGNLADGYTHEQRKRSDAILTTAQTVLADNPKLNARIDRHTFAKPVLVLDRRGRLTGKEAIFSTAAQVIVFTAAGISSVCKTHYEVESHPDGFCLPSILACVAKMGYYSVWVEAGATFFHALHANHLVQETLLYISARNIGAQTGQAALDAVKPENALEQNWRIFDETAVLTLYWGS